MQVSYFTVLFLTYGSFKDEWLTTFEHKCGKKIDLITVRDYGIVNSGFLLLMFGARCGLKGHSYKTYPECNTISEFLYRSSWTLLYLSPLLIVPFFETKSTSANLILGVCMPCFLSFFWTFKHYWSHLDTIATSNLTKDK